MLRRAHHPHRDRSPRGDGRHASRSGGLLTRLRQTKIKTGPNAGRFMGRFVLADLDGDVGILLFSDQLEKNRRLLIEDTVVLVTGQVRDSSGDVELRAERIESLEEVTAGDVEVELELAPTVSMAQMLALRNLLASIRGRRAWCCGWRCRRAGCGSRRASSSASSSTTTCCGWSRACSAKAA